MRHLLTGIVSIPYRCSQTCIIGIARLPVSAFCVSAVHKCLRKLVRKIWKEVGVGEDRILFAAAGDIQAKPMRFSGGLDLLVSQRAAT